MDLSHGRSAEPVIDRRGFLLGAAALGVSLPALARPPVFGHGRIDPPAALPDISIIMQDGARTRLREALSGYTTAVQCIFTTCTDICPIEGTIFSRVQELIPGAFERKVRLLSLSTSGEADGPAALREWMAQFGARGMWRAGGPIAADLGVFLDFFSDGGNLGGTHTGQIYIVGADGRVTWRTRELPEPDEVARLLTA